jgi:hypothetical protein
MIFAICTFGTHTVFPAPHVVILDHFVDLHVPLLNSANIVAQFNKVFARIAPDEIEAGSETVEHNFRVVGSPNKPLNVIGKGLHF